ncbi:protein kinase domain-containing protein [Blastopirellula marina]|uniref:non-specific serine/threonine protein kinase n=1 Tax=Blastopirellula marina DSM 3645 TaxID=314230 RepID=A3ZY48_9BACT|nr:serine/threonine-protein kinase [Blastopirellula marina]EAQ78519.1 probable serine/threonine protein kinase [Blastopirellula marina DSM 3645]
MTIDERIYSLLDDILESGQSPEEACAEYPELLPVVKTQLEKYRRVEAHLESLLPEPPTELPLDSKTLAAKWDELPTIPGYEVQEVLGRGGMGIVYKARQVNLNRPVALKMLLTGAYASRVEILRFIREAESVAALHHANVTQIYDVGEVDGLPYFTMEYVSGGNLAQKCGNQPQPLRWAAEVVAVLARALHAAHQAGIIHRDLKPANILLTDAEQPKITDFGLARRLDADFTLTLTGARMGTPSYMAPEQVLGKKSTIGAAIDIYALGAILYELISGRPPFRANSVAELERQLVFDEPNPPRRLNNNVPPDLETICLKCLQKDPYRRYASAQELAEDLERFLRYEPILARPVSQFEYVWRWVRRNPAVAGLLICLIAFAGLLAGEILREWSLANGRDAEKSRLTARMQSAIQLEQQGRYPEARAILGRLGDGGFEDLRQRINQSLDDLNYVEELDLVGLHRSSVLDNHYDLRFNLAKADATYEHLFAKMGVAKPFDDPPAVAARIRDADIKQPLISALDDWSVCTSDAARRDWILDVVRRADVDTTGWRDRVRDPRGWNDAENLDQLSRIESMANLSVDLLRAIADRMDEANIDSIDFRKRVQQAHPADFLANFALADALRESDPHESVRYYQAALAIRPVSAPVHNNLALALAAVQREDEAIAYLESALQIDARFVPALVNRGILMRSQGRFKEAFRTFRQVLVLAPNDAFTCYQIGLTHLAVSETIQAILAFERAVQCDSKFTIAQFAFVDAMIVAGQSQAAADRIQLLLSTSTDPADILSLRQRLDNLTKSREDAAAKP